MDMDGYAALFTDPLGETDVIGVRVSEDHGADVIETAAHGGELGGERVPVPGRAGVHDRDRVVVLDQVRIDQPGT
jgi:hypothetical protein